MKSNLKVLHLSSEKSWRGGEQQIAYLLGETSNNGVTNFVAARKNSVFENYCVSKNIKVFPVSFSNSFDIKTALSIKKICRENQIDIIHLHSAKSQSLAVLSAVLGNKTPLFLSRRVDFVPKQNWLTKFKYNHAAIKCIAGVSDKITSIMRAYVNEPHKCITIHSGVDLEKFPATRSSENKLRTEFNIGKEVFLIGNTSALEHHKDYFTFINTITRLGKKNLNIKAFIIGDGSLKQQLAEHAIQCGVSDKIIFTGFRKDIIEILPCLDLFLMTSNEEGLGTSILDAFLAKVPVVATAAGGIPEMVIHEKTGLLAPISNAEKLATYVESLMNDASLGNRLVNGASDLVKEFSKEKTAEKTLAAYNKILSGK